MGDSLVLIDQSKWSSLLDIFPGPEGITARVTIKTQIFNLERTPDLPVKFYAPFGNPNDGLVVIFEGAPMNEISVFCLKEDKSILMEALLDTNVINKKKPNLFCSVMPQICPLIINMLQKCTIKYEVDHTVIAYISKEKAQNFLIPEHPGMKIRILESKYAPEINEVWPHRFPGSVKYFEKILGYGYGIGLINEKNEELAGWIFTNKRGDLHSLHVKDKYRRQGIAQILVKTMSKNVANRDIEVFGCVVVNNTASKSMFSKCGFEFSYVTSWIANFPESD